MSNRFEIIAKECLGPFSKCIHLNDLLTNNTLRILESFSHTPLEKLLIKTCEKLPDCRTSLILWTVIALKQNLLHNDLLQIYTNLEEFHEYLIQNVRRN